VDADLDTLATALYARTDDLLKAFPERAPWRPGTGITPKISDAELLTLAVLQALLGFVSEARWLRFARKHLRHLFPYLPGQPGYNKRLRKLAARNSGSRSADLCPWFTGRDGGMVMASLVEIGKSLVEMGKMRAAAGDEVLVKGRRVGDGVARA
jgi:hypothetical protein